MKLKWEEIGEVGSLLGLLCGGDGDLPGPEWLEQCPMSLTGSGMAAIAMGDSVAWRRIGEGEGEDVVVRGACGQGMIDAVTALQWVEGELLLDGGGGWENVGGGASPRAGGSCGGGGRTVKEMLMVGCSSGLVRIYAANGSLTLSQAVHDRKVRAFKLRGFSNVDQTQELLIAFEDSVVARVDGASLISVLRAPPGARQKLSLCKWRMSSQGTLTDVACCGLDEQVCSPWFASPKAPGSPMGVISQPSLLQAVTKRWPTLSK